jgi:hypothetical protein
MTLKLMLKVSLFYIFATTLSFSSFAAAPKNNKIVREKKENKACTKNDRERVINAHNTKFPKVMDRCASDAWGNSAETSACLREKYKGLSVSCSNCYGAMAGCTKDNCKFKCMANHFGDSCLGCIDKYCREKLVVCTGVKENKLPPRK